jgi:hypothetical protein
MVYVSAAVLMMLNLGFWVGMRFNLPGTWLMVLVTALLKWWQPGYVLVSWTVLGVATGLAALGEGLECVLGVAGSHHAGRLHTGRGVGHCRQPRGRNYGHGTPGANRGHPHRCLSRGLCRLAARGFVGRASAVPKLRGGLGGSRGLVLGHHF